MIRLSPTRILKYEACPQQYWLEVVQKIRPQCQPANLVFGRVIHHTLETWFRGWASGQAPEPGALFTQQWEAACQRDGITYSATQSPDALMETGQALLAAWPSAWASWDRQVAQDVQGMPLIERKLEVKIADQVTLVGQADLIVSDQEGQLECLDLKTPRTPTDPSWLAVADQLTGYQVLFDAHAPHLGMAPLARLGLIELIKRKVTAKSKGPEVGTPITAPRRSPADTQDYLRKVLWVAEDIARGRFPKRGLMAHNSPCTQCAVRALCQEGDPEGLVLPDATGSVTT